MLNKEHGRKKRHIRVRKKVSGTAERPRLAVHRSSKNLYVQVVDDLEQKTLFSFSSSDKDFFQQAPKDGGKIAIAESMGKFYASKLKDKGVDTIAFDRGGYLYHGRIKALAEGLRAGGIKF